MAKRVTTPPDLTGDQPRFDCPGTKVEFQQELKLLKQKKVKEELSNQIQNKLNKFKEERQNEIDQDNQVNHEFKVKADEQIEKEKQKKIQNNKENAQAWIE